MKWIINVTNLDTYIIMRLENVYRNKINASG